MIQYRWYIGTAQQDGTPVDGDQKKKVADLLIEKFGGATMYATAGMWRDDGEIYQEHTIVFEVIAEGGQGAATIAKDLARIAGQKSVLWTSVRLNSGLSHANPS